MMSDRVFTAIALGSNLGERADNLRRACVACGTFISEQQESRIYSTEAMYLEDQPDFLNMALCGYFSGSALELLQNLKQKEREFGRIATEHYGARIIDLDIIFFAQNVIQEDSLIVPHPKLQERDFVLSPLMDICPDFIHPLLGISVSGLHFELGSAAELWVS